MVDKIDEMIINFGALGYDEKLAEKIIGEPIKKIKNYKKLYERGQALAQYAIDLKLFEMAKSGDIKAMDKLEFRKKRR